MRTFLYAAAAAGLMQGEACAETFISFYGGKSHTRGSDLRVTHPGSDATFRGVTWSDKSFEAPPYYGLRLSHFPAVDSWWGAMVDFTHYKIYADTTRVGAVDGIWSGSPVSETAPIDSRVQRFNISHGVNFVGVNFLFRWIGSPDERRNWEPYAGGGPIYYILHPENTVAGRQNEEKYRRSGFGWQALAGLRYRLSPRISVFAEAKLDQGKAKVDTAGPGRAETRLRTSHAVAGVSVAF